MQQGWRIAGRVGAVFVAAMAALCVDVSAAWAQAASCNDLNAELRQLSANGDFRNADQSNSQIRALQSQMQDAQSNYNSEGCMRAQTQGQPQTPECRSYAKQYLSAQSQLKSVQRQASSGSDIEAQREDVLQQIARFGCNSRGTAGRFADDNGDQQPVRRPRNFLEELFGGPSNQDDGYGDNNTYNGQEQVEDPYANTQKSDTIRTVCVRKSDGYYWPISYATARDYIPQDAQTCSEECPGQDVALYSYANPGQDPEQMVDTNGQPYTALPNAFAYRKQVDATNTCKPAETVGQITMDDLGNGFSRAMITYGTDKFPLPVRDPRTVEKAVPADAKYATAVDIPLPRPRPSATQAATPVTPPTSAPVVSAKSRIVKVGDKIVRVVGPDTPYAPATLTTGNSG